MGFFQEFKDSIRKYPFIKRWTIILVLILIISGTYLTWFTYVNTNQEVENINFQIDPNVVEKGLSSDDYVVPDSAEKVTTGIYVDRIKSISLKDNIWTVDFFIWFKWKGNNTPGDTFQIVDGSIDKKEMIKNSTTGDEKFALYKVTATITKKFDMFRFPVDNQFLTIDIQDKQLTRQELIYIPDNESSMVGPAVNVPGYSIDDIKIVEKPFTYDSTMGESMDKSTTYSQLRSGVLLFREDLTVFLISLIGIFVAVFAGLGSLTIMSFQGRFSMEGSAMFVGITNMVLITNLAPTGIITVAHIITAFGLFIIALSLLESAISISHFKKGDEEFARKLDLVSLPILAIGFICTVVAILISAW